MAWQISLLVAQPEPDLPERSGWRLSVVTREQYGAFCEGQRRDSSFRMQSMFLQAGHR